MVAAEHLLGAVDGELLDDVDVLAAAVVALAGIALGVLVRQDAALALEDGLGHEVLGGDHLQRAPLAIELEVDGLGDLRVDLGERALEVVGLEFGHERHGTTGGGRRDECQLRVAMRPQADIRAAAATVSAGTAPARRTAHSPASSKRRRSITVDGVPGQLAGVEHEVGARPDRRRHLLDAPCVGAAGDVGRALQHDAASAAQQRHVGHPQPQPLAAGERPAPARVGQQQRHPAGQQPPHQRARARAELRQRRDRERGVEEHHRARLAGRPPLQRVQPLDRLRVVRVAGEAVDGVGGEDRHAACGDAGVEGAGRPWLGSSRRHCLGSLVQ